MFSARSLALLTTAALCATAHAANTVTVINKCSYALSLVEDRNAGGGLSTSTLDTGATSAAIEYNDSPLHVRVYMALGDPNNNLAFEAEVAMNDVFYDVVESVSGSAVGNDFTLSTSSAACPGIDGAEANISPTDGNTSHHSYNGHEHNPLESGPPFTAPTTMFSHNNLLLTTIALATAAHAGGLLIISNQCTSPITMHLINGDNVDPRTIDAGTPSAVEWYNEDPVAVRVYTDDAAKYIEFEAATTAGATHYEVAKIDGGFGNDSFDLAPSDAGCASIGGDATFYQHPDDAATNSCADGTTFAWTICS
ncbi:hypothetical protein IWZ03DRAFT_419091 [Phyllosticta citriasiana]|uniref:Uncharacterized protein n=1 Tax=Phyllosticta citriasiana TaxID=595635 RepID=A0ABR1K832_9PEZI